MTRLLIGCLSLALIAACSGGNNDVADTPAASAPTETAQEFVARSNAELKELGKELGAANWVRSTYITHDTAIIASAASEKYSAWHSNMVKQALAYEGQELDPSTRRAIELL